MTGTETTAAPAWVAVLDVNPEYFGNPNSVSLAETIDLVCATVRAYKLLRPLDRLAVVAAFPDKTQYVLQWETGNVEIELQRMRESILGTVNAMADGNGLVGSTLMAQALSRAICFIRGKGKIVVFETSSRFSDLSKQHVQISNCGWCVENRIVVDLVSLDGRSEISAALANLCVKSGGVQVSVSGDFQARLQAVLFHVVHLAQGVLKTADSKVLSTHTGAVCICHGSPLNCGYVCSVCLAIFCSETAGICGVCGSRFRRDLRDNSTPLNHRSFSELVV